MPRLARVVVPGRPHHITQRRNRRQPTFLCDDYEAYLDLMAQWCAELDLQVWAYWLMPNHVRLIVVPASEEELRRAIGGAHRRHTRRRGERTGRATGSEAFLAELERPTGRRLQRQGPGPEAC